MVKKIRIMVNIGLIALGLLFGATIASAATGADLTVISMSINSTNSVPSITVANIGTADVSVTNGFTYIYIDNTLKYTYDWSTLPDQNFLKAGGSSVMEIDALSSGIHTIKACIDATSVVTEFDEKNNCIEGSLSSTGTTSTTALPDLYIQNIVLDGNNVLSVRVRNRGDAKVSTTNGFTYVYIDGTLTYSYDWNTLSNKRFLKARRSSLLKVGTLTDGVHTVKACVDPTNVVTESSDSNNCLEVTVGTSDLPDLYVNSISLKKNELNIVVKNRGDADVTSTTGVISVYIDGTLTYTYDWSTLSNKNFLKAHRSSVIKTGTISGSGSHTVKVVIDSGGAVTESNENNNSLEVTVNVK